MTACERTPHPTPNATVASLRTFYLPHVVNNPETRKKIKNLSRLSDGELLNTVLNPKDGCHVRVNRRSNPNMVDNGNHRVRELLRRARNNEDPTKHHERNPKGGPAITWNTPIYLEYIDGFVSRPPSDHDVER
jgi:hypothetical protein